MHVDSFWNAGISPYSRVGFLLFGRYVYCFLALDEKLVQPGGVRHPIFGLISSLPPYILTCGILADQFPATVQI